MSNENKTGSKAPRRKTTFDVRYVDENTYDEIVNRADGKKFLRTIGGDKPTIDAVKEAWKDERETFREI